MLTAAQIIARIRTKVEDPNDTYFNLSDYVRVYNDALDEISETTEINESNAYVKRRKYATYTDLRGIVPPTFLRITSVWNAVTQKWLDPATVRELDDTVGQNWEERTDQTRWWFMRGLWHLGTYPAPGGDYETLKIYYTSMMPHVSEDNLNVSPPIPPYFVEPLENYMMYELLSEKKEVQKALSYYSSFSTQIVSLKDMAENRMRRDRVPRIGARR